MAYERREMYEKKESEKSWMLCPLLGIGDVFLIYWDDSYGRADVGGVFRGWSQGQGAAAFFRVPGAPDEKLE